MIASARLRTPSLRRMCSTWVATVLGLMNSCRAMSLVAEPFAEEVEHLQFALRQPPGLAELARA